MTTWEKEWLVSIRPSDLVFCIEGLIDIQPYVPAWFSRQFVYSQGVLGHPGRIRGRIEDAILQDALHAWLFFFAVNIGTSFRLPQYSVPIYTSVLVEWYAINRTSFRFALRDQLFEVGVVTDSNTDGLINCEHLEAYVHGACEWKIGLYEDGFDCYVPFNNYKYGVENQSFIARRKGQHNCNHPSRVSSSLSRP